MWEHSDPAGLDLSIDAGGIPKVIVRTGKWAIRTAVAAVRRVSEYD